ncbi:uncharacterized protein [Asterias amurensis]|uniref:uncharacterized protein n=1 Tax=Asterias amurensis TaxID=7602 RepID=UPI003AB64CF4
MFKKGVFPACFCGRTAYVLAVLLLGIFSARVVCGQNALQTQDSSEEQIFVRTGETVILPCNQSVPVPSPSAPFVLFFIQWRRLDLPFPFYIGFLANEPYVDPQYEGRASVLDDLSLQINDIVAEDDGMYECQVIVLNGNYDDIGNGTFIHLTVIGPPRFLSTPPALVIFHQGKTSELQCIAKGTPTPTVTWLKDSAPITGDHIRTTVSSIVFEGVQEHDGGTYVCTAESEEGAVQHTVRLLVHGAPFIFIPPHNISVIRDETAILECEAEASPSNITQRWYYQDDYIETVPSLRGRYALLPEGGLTVERVRPEDEGWYSCSPTNGLGVPPVARGYLDVQYAAYVVGMPANAYISRGLDVTLSCTADADPPVLNVKWYKAGAEIIQLPSNRYRISSEGSLIITDTEFNDSGSYTCAPYNKIGTAGVSTATLLTVKDPPTFVVRPKLVYQRSLGDDVTMPCSAVGEPSPTITWRMLDGKLAPFRSTVSQTSLMIRGLTKEDHGMYQCQAANEIATIISTTQLIVELTSPHKPLNVTVVTTISSAHVSWQPAYSGGFTQTFTVWYRQGETDSDWLNLPYIPERVNFQLVSGLEPSEEYQFGVVASNQLGDSDLSDVVTALTKDPEVVVSPTDETGKTVIPIFYGLTPSPPRNLTITSSQEGLILAWYPPAVWGHFVDRYSIEYRLHGPWVVLYDRIDGDQSTMVLGKLLTNMTYQFRMFAFTPALYSSPSEVVTGFTGGIAAYIPPSPTAKIPQFGEPGILAGVIAAVCFLVITLLLSLIAICVSHRRKKRKRIALFSIAVQTPQPLIHRSPQTPSQETPLPTPIKQPTGIVNKLITKISPKHKTANASAPHPSRQAHLTSNGKLPNGGHAEPSISERLLGRSSQRSASYKPEGEDSRWMVGSRDRPRRLASEQALELDEFESSAGVYSVQDGRIRSHGRYNNDRLQPHTTQSDSNSEVEGARGLHPDSAHPVRGDYVYYHGEMFITSNSEDNEDYDWASESGTVEGSGEGGVVNHALEVDEVGVVTPRCPPAAQNQYVDMPTRNTWQWDRDWADDTLSHRESNTPLPAYHDVPQQPQQQQQRSNSRSATLPRQSTRKDIRRLTRDDYGSEPPPAYQSTPTWSDSISTIQGNSPRARHPDYEYNQPLEEKSNYRVPPNTELSRGREISPYRKSSPNSKDYDELRNSPRRTSPDRNSGEAAFRNSPTGRSPNRNPSEATFRNSPRRTSPNRNSGEPTFRNSPRRTSPHRSPGDGTLRISPTRSPIRSPGEATFRSDTSRSPERQPRPHRQETYLNPNLSKRSPEISGSPIPDRSLSPFPDRSRSPYPERSRSPYHHRDNYPLYDRTKSPRRDGNLNRTKSPTSDDDQKTLSRGRLGRDSGGFRKPVEQVMKRSPARSEQGSQGWTNPRSPRSGATSLESYADPDTLQGTFRDADPTIIEPTRRPQEWHSVNGHASPQGGAIPKRFRTPSPSSRSKPKIHERVTPQGGSKSKIYQESLSPDSTERPKRSSLSPRDGRQLSSEIPSEPSLSPTTTRGSISSVDSRPGSTKPIPLPQSYISAQRSLLSPNSQCSASSGYASRNTSQSTSSRGRTSSVPSIHDPIDSPFSDSAGPFSNVSSKESEEPFYEFDPMLRESELLDALKKYYEPVEIKIPNDEVYQEGTGKVANMEKRCEELKREFQEYQRLQDEVKRGSFRLTSSV